MDENAWVMGGVSGHAGLFGEAKAVHAILNEWRRARLGQSTIISPGTFESFCTPEMPRILDKRDFTLGFDTPTLPGSQAGEKISPNAIGHLGYAGTSFWWDLDRDAWIILLTNRAMPSRSNELIKKMRPLLHDAIWKYL